MSEAFVDAQPTAPTPTAPPNPVTALLLTHVIGFLYDLTWNHDRLNLDRFEVLYRDDEADPWLSYMIVPEESLFVSGNAYKLHVTSPNGRKWVVRALNSLGEASI